MLRQAFSIDNSTHRSQLVRCRRQNSESGSMRKILFCLTFAAMASIDMTLFIDVGQASHLPRDHSISKRDVGNSSTTIEGNTCCLPAIHIALSDNVRRQLEDVRGELAKAKLNIPERKSEEFARQHRRKSDARSRGDVTYRHLLSRPSIVEPSRRERARSDKENAVRRFNDQQRLEVQQDLRDLLRR